MSAPEGNGYSLVFPIISTFPQRIQTFANQFPVSCMKMQYSVNDAKSLVKRVSTVFPVTCCGFFFPIRYCILLID